MNELEKQKGSKEKETENYVETMVRSLQGHQSFLLITLKPSADAAHFEEDLTKLGANAWALLGPYDVIIEIAVGIASSTLYEVMKYLYLNRKKVKEQITLFALPKAKKKKKPRKPRKHTARRPKLNSPK
jgi:hypothetical protein